MPNQSFEQKLKAANIRIRRIKEAGMQPITLKSPADIIRNYVEKKGTSQEGEFKTWKQVKEKYGDKISQEEYEQAITEFLSGEYGQQTYFREAFAYYSERIITQLIEAGFEDEEISKLYNLPKRAFIEAIEKASLRAKEDKDMGGSSNSFYYYIYQYLDTKEE